METCQCAYLTTWENNWSLSCEEIKVVKTLCEGKDDSMTKRI